MVQQLQIKDLKYDYKSWEERLIMKKGHKFQKRFEFCLNTENIEDESIIYQKLEETNNTIIMHFQKIFNVIVNKEIKLDNFSFLFFDRETHTLGFVCEIN